MTWRCSRRSRRRRRAARSRPRARYRRQAQQQQHCVKMSPRLRRGRRRETPRQLRRRTPPSAALPDILCVYARPPSSTSFVRTRYNEKMRMRVHSRARSARRVAGGMEAPSAVLTKLQRELAGLRDDAAAAAEETAAAAARVQALEAAAAAEKAAAESVAPPPVGDHPPAAAAEAPLPPPPPVLKECCVCLSGMPTSELLVIGPCGHRCLCSECWQNLQPPAARRCSICSVVATTAMRVYEAWA